jgi:LPXTG-motif cell wall-anchored protein
VLPWHRLLDSALTGAPRRRHDAGKPRALRRAYIVALAAAAALALAAPAGALVGTIDQAVQGLRSSPVYVDPAARNILSESDARRIAQEIDAKNAGPMYIVVLPAAAADTAGGDPVSVLREIQKRLGRPGVYAGIIGSHFRAGATAGILPKGETAKLADEAFRKHRSDGAAVVLTDFVDRVAAARHGGGSSGGGSSGAGGLVLLGLLVLGGGAFVLVRRRNQRRELEEVKHVARDDLIALGDEIRALDVDASMPNANAEGKQHYNQAVDIYQSAEQGLDRVRRAEDLRPISEELERGRYEMQSAQALFEGKEAPAREAPCFFDPRHGPSVRTVEWAPPGGTPRPVPACAMDAERVEQGLDPNIRELDYGGRRIPYWAAPPAYTPFFGGFWGGFGGFGGFFPGLLIGEMLGGGLGGGWGDAGWDGQGGDGGDFSGGGGGDFGGGDFGGGDF